MPSHLPDPSQPLYAQIAQGIAQLIDGQVFKAGKRLPSVREVAAQNTVSVSTAVQAYRWLEERNLITARPKSGYYVASRNKGPALPATSRPPKYSLQVDSQNRSEQIGLENFPGPIVSFGGTCPKDPDFFDEARVRAAVNRATREHRFSLVAYTDSTGTPALKESVSRRALHLGCRLQPDNIVISASCINAVSMCLRAVTKPGDVVALESPTHFGFLDLIESLNLRALEIPTHPKDGMSLSALQLALDTQPVKAVLSVPTLSNPLGAVMKNADKKALVQMLTKHQVPLIEDVVFNDLLASDERRKAAKAYDVDGWVMVCGSFSKTLTPGVRMGWCEAGRWKDSVMRLKSVHGIQTTDVLEHALADLLTQGNYEARMRRLSGFLRERLEEARGIISDCFPSGTRVSRPASGYTLWVELPETFNTMELFKQCMAQGISFGPGALFTATDRFNHCLRLSFAGTWTDVERQALRKIGEISKGAA
jgi:DNA-binding transcriptional MocR family regulator